MEDALRFMKKAGNTPLDAATRVKLPARRDDSELITGQVEKLGSVYLLSATIVDPDTGVILRSVSDEADSMATIPTAVRRLSNQVRGVAGASLARIKEESNARLEQATTPSLRALQLYSQGMVFVNQRGGGELLEQAVQPTPGTMYTWPIAMATCGNNKPADRHFKRAYELQVRGSGAVFILGSITTGWVRLKKRYRPMKCWFAYILTTTGERAICCLLIRRPGVTRTAERKKQVQLRPNDYVANLQA